MRLNKRYSPDYKRRKKEAIEAIIAKVKTKAQVSREFNISPQAVAQWVTKFKRDLDGPLGRERRGRPKAIPLPSRKLARIKRFVIGGNPSVCGISAMNVHMGNLGLQYFLKSHNLKVVGSNPTPAPNFNPL